jgi:2-methylcitrate dehydratase PrpD
MTHTESLATFAADLTLDAVPSRVVAAAKRQVLDAITCAVAAMTVPGGRIPVEVGFRLGRGEARILANGHRTDPLIAAFTNTQMSIALDLSSNLFFTQGLSGLALFPALAIAERDRLPGRRLLAAVIAGYEVAARVALSFPPPNILSSDGRGVVANGRPRSRWIILGGAAAVASVLGLPPQLFTHALVLSGASATAPRSERLFRDDVVPLAKYGLVGHMATAVFVNGELAAGGFTGDERLFEDEKDGFHRSIGSQLDDVGALARDLGTRWWIEEARPKRYPSGTHNQQALHALSELFREQRLQPEQIRSVEVSRAIGTGELFAVTAPRNDVAAQFSLPFQVAALACDIPPLRWGDAIGDERVLALASRVSLVSDERAVAQFADLSDLERRSPWSVRTHVSVNTERGTFERWSSYDDLSNEDAVAKFRSYCEEVLDGRQIEAVVDRVLGLDRIDDVRHLTEAFAPAAGSSH